MRLWMFVIDSIRYVGSEWSTVRFDGKLVGWDIDSEIVPPHPSGHYHIRHVGGYPKINPPNSLASIQLSVSSPLLCSATSLMMTSHFLCAPLSRNPPLPLAFFLIVFILGVDSWEIKLVFEGNEPIEFRASGINLSPSHPHFFTSFINSTNLQIGIHFTPSNLLNQMTAFLPAWYTPTSIVTSLSTYTF